MKESSTEPPKKKLKQARLPFQILSPEVKNPVATHPPQRKRKASETPSDDVAVSEITDVKENQVKPLEKKSKIVSSDEIHQTTQVKSIDNKEKKEEECIESVEEKRSKSDKSEVPKKGKSKTSTPLISIKKSNNTKSSQKRLGSGKKGSEKKNNKTVNEKPDIVDFIDLSESPSKSVPKDEKLSTATVVPLYSDEVSSPIKKTGENDAGDKNTEQQTTEENTASPESREKEEARIDSKVIVEVEENNKKTNRKLVEDTDSIGVKEIKLVEKVEEKKVNDSNPNKIDDIKEVNEKLAEADKTQIKDSSKITEVNSTTDVKAEEILNRSDTKVIEKESSTNEVQSIDNFYELKITPRKDTETSTEGSQSSRTPPVNESLTSMDVSPTSVGSTPSLSGTPSRKSINSPLLTPRRMTPKQLKRLKEREEKQKEKERLKQEKELKRVEEKEEKMRIKQEKEEEKLKLKQEKEEEKRKEKEEKERKKQAELEQKNEEKRLKEEEKRIKEEEKRLKEEEKRAKEEEEKKKKEEKRMKEEQKLAEKRKSAQAFASFFVKSGTKCVPADEVKDNTPVESTFQPFEVKNDMRLAPVGRVALTEERRKELEKVVGSGSPKGQRLYLELLRSSCYCPGSAVRTWPPSDDLEDDVIIIESEKPNDIMETDDKENVKKSEKRRKRAKLLQFHENRRPPYWGTWCKKSEFVRPRNPFSQDKMMFEYEVDSDDEWEEPEDGESLRGSEDEESQDEQYEEDNDMFVPHGYLSDEEGQDEFDDKSPEGMKAKLKLLQMEFEAERSEKQEKLKPRLIGCVWFCNSESDPAAIGSHIAEMFLSRRAVWEGPLPIVMASSIPSSPSTPTDSVQSTIEETRGCKPKLVHNSTLPHIVKKVHGNRKKLKKLMTELLEELQEMGHRPSKRCLALKIREIASWTLMPEIGHLCWFVKEEVRKEHGLMELVVTPASPPPPTTPTTNITKFTKVLTSDERLKLLREIPGNNTSANDSCNSTPNVTTASAKQSTSNVKTPNIKLSTPLSKPSHPVKKRVSLISSPFPTQATKQSPCSMLNFVQPVGKLAEKEEKTDVPTTEKIQTDTKKTEEKVKKRITPITLTTFVSKPPPKEEECVVLSD